MLSKCLQHLSAIPHILHYAKGLSIKLNFLFLVISHSIHTYLTFSTTAIWSLVLQSRVFSRPTHNRFTALLYIVRDHPGEQVPER